MSYKDESKIFKTANRNNNNNGSTQAPRQSIFAANKNNFPAALTPKAQARKDEPKIAEKATHQGLAGKEEGLVKPEKKLKKLVKNIEKNVHKVGMEQIEADTLLSLLKSGEANLSILA